MRLQELIDTLKINQPMKQINKNDWITGVTDDSRQVENGYVFVAVNGYQVDGHAYIEEAISKGASVIIGEEEVRNLSVPYLKTDNSRKTLGVIASCFYGHPSKGKIVIGVTGTNGKTTTSHLIKHICEQNGKTCSMFGTIDYVVNGKAVPGVQTTPSAPMLQKLIAESEDEIIVMEVSSHGLQQYRLEGIAFDYCVFTNLHQDHLDYHDSMEDYFLAKAKLFTMMKENGKAVINSDNSWGEKLAGRLKEESIPFETVGEKVSCDYQIKALIPEDSKAVVLEKEDKDITILSPLEGKHNIYNTLEAFAVGRLLGLSAEQIDRALQSFQGVRGRFEIYHVAEGVTAVVDYAHTADSIAHTLETVRSKGAAFITHVFGFRGDRDIRKRKDMLAASVNYSDSYILTLDDLNSVPYEEMVRSLEEWQNAYGGSQGFIIPDRTLAIEEALARSGKDHWVVITGKGHENYQQSYHYPTQSDKETLEYFASIPTKTFDQVK